MIITISDIVQESTGGGHLVVTLVVDGQNIVRVMHRSFLWEALVDISNGIGDKWDVLAVFLRNHIKKYLEINPAATLAQIRADIIANFRVVV